jgi:hypothetical protein
MQILLTKNIGKPHVIKHIRKDGSETWMASDDFFIKHDLSHFAIETILQFKSAFYGMVENGMDIKDFDNREKRNALLITAEAWYAENMANLFLMEIRDGYFEDFNAVSHRTFAEMNLPYPSLQLSSVELNSIRNYLRQLLAQWDKLPVGETLRLTF